MHKISTRNAVVLAAFIGIITSLAFACRVPASVDGQHPDEKTWKYQSGLIYPHDKHVDFYGCGDCHSGVKDSPEAGYPDKDLCLECHDEADHSMKKNKGCYICHQKPLKNKIDRPHSPVYASAGFKHSDHVDDTSDCKDCHGDVASTKKTGDIKNPEKSTCARCH